MFPTIKEIEEIKIYLSDLVLGSKLVNLEKNYYDFYQINYELSGKKININFSYSEKTKQIEFVIELNSGDIKTGSFNLNEFH